MFRWAMAFLCVGSLLVAAACTMSIDSTPGEGEGTTGDAPGEGDYDGGPAPEGVQPSAEGDAYSDAYRSIEDTGFSDDSSPFYREDVSGFVTVRAEHGYLSDSEFDSYSASAQFIDVTTASVAEEAMDVLLEAGGVDSCSAIFFEGWSTEREGEVVDWLMAGTVILSSGPQSVEFNYWKGGSVENYDASLSELGLEPRYGDTYALKATGDEAPPRDIDPVLTLPPRFGITAPSLPISEPLDIGGLDVEWDGALGGDETMELSVLVLPSDDTESGWYEIRCNLLDDGAFEIPVEVRDAVPAGWIGQLTLGRYRVWKHPEEDERYFLGRAFVGYIFDFVTE